MADVHLGLRMGDPDERERRFVAFLKGIPRDSRAVYLLGDIWDFWFEYKDVIPRLGGRVLAELIALVDAGVEVCFFSGNHDMWCFSHFESLGMKKLEQPSYVTIEGARFCLGHGDGLGRLTFGYRLMLRIFRSRVCQRLFAALHPRIAFGIGHGWSASNREEHSRYRFRGPGEPLYQYAAEHVAEADYFIFGHFHDIVDTELPGGARLLILGDWMRGGTPHAYFDGKTLSNRA